MLAHGNMPEFVAVCIGMDAWQRAKRRNEGSSDWPALVLPPGEEPARYSWPVSGSYVVLEVDAGPSTDQLRQLAHVLLQAGAVVVVEWWPAGQGELRRYTGEVRDAA